jgi:hypothetical protein
MCTVINKSWSGALLSTVLALGCGSAHIEVLPAPVGAESYTLSAQRKWICDESANRDLRHGLGLAITAVGSVATMVGAAWLTDQGARGDRIEAGWVATTFAGAGSAIGGGVLLYTAAAREEDIEQARLSYARRLRHADPNSTTAVYCGTAASAPPSRPAPRKEAPDPIAATPAERAH